MNQYPVLDPIRRCLITVVWFAGTVWIWRLEWWWAILWAIPGFIIVMNVVGFIMLPLYAAAIAKRVEAEFLRKIGGDEEPPNS